MSSRLGWWCLVVMSIAGLSQPVTTGAQDQPWVWGRAKTMNADSIPQLDAEAVRRKAIHDDAETLSALSILLQADLQQLQRGMLSHDLNEDLKKVEKLSRKLRREVAP